MGSRLDRQSFLGPDSERVLGAIRAAIVGFGGGGSHIGQQLAHIGVGHFVMLDPQAIEDTNLNRLVGGTEADVGVETPKVDIAARLIRAVNSKAEVQALQATWQSHIELLRDCDVIFGCVGFKVPRADEVQSEPGAEGALPVVPEADSGAPFTTRPA